MSYENIIYEIDERGIVTITLNRPDVLNALSPALINELLRATKHFSEDPAAKLLIVTGAGRAFSAGVDLQSMNSNIQGGQFSADTILNEGNQFLELIKTMPKVAIAMVNGFCFTGATELMLGFDLIYAADEAKIGDTHTKWGIAPKWGMSQRLALRVGQLKARELSFTAEPVKGIEAARIGLVNASFPLEQLGAEVKEVAKKILSNSAQTVAAMKELYNVGAYGTLEEGIKYESETRYDINDREEFLREFKKNKS